MPCVSTAFASKTVPPRSRRPILCGTLFLTSYRVLFLHNWPTADPAPAGGGWRVVSVPLLAVLHTAFVAERAFKQLVNNDAAMASLELGTLALQTKAGQKVMFLLDGGLFASSAGGSRAAEVSTHTCTHPIARRAIRSTLCELAIRSPKTAERAAALPYAPAPAARVHFDDSPYGH